MTLRSLLKDIDLLLRGGFTSKDELAAGRVSVPIRTLTVAGLLLGALYGVFMGLFSVLRAENPSFEQLVATTVKVPLLFLLTLAVTYPSLYVFSALSRSRLEPLPTLRLLLAAVAVNLAILASFGPVTGFFTLSTESYAFMVLLNVVVFAIAGLVGVGFLAKALDAVFTPDEGAAASGPPAVPDPPAAPAPTAGGKTDPWKAPARTFEPPPRAPAGRSVLRVWIVIFAVVGAQMGWILRPFVGAPNEPFTLFRARHGNFLQGVLDALRDLFQ